MASKARDACWSCWLHCTFFGRSFCLDFRFWLLLFLEGGPDVCVLTQLSLVGFFTCLGRVMLIASEVG